MIPALLLFSVCAGAYEVTLVGGGRMDIPEAWFADLSDPSVPAWYSPDRGGASDVLLWESGSWAGLEEFTEAVRPEGARGEAVVFPCWDGEAALADWTFTTSSGEFRGWFLMVTGTGADVRISAISPAAEFEMRQPFLLSILDSYVPAESWALSPGAVAVFLELSGERTSRPVRGFFGNEPVNWISSPGSDQVSQDVIEREALVLSAYSGSPELFYPAWKRYYRLIYRDSYSRLNPVWEALSRGPLAPLAGSKRELADALLAWLQGFSYGSTQEFSDLLAPSAACSAGKGDCDSLALVMLILMDRFGVDGRLILSQQARHALAGLDVPGEGLRYVDDEGSWIVAELTAALPLGALPERLDNVNDWFAVDLHYQE